MFMSPGMSHRPVIPMTLAPGGTAVESAGPIWEMRSPVIRTVAFLIAGPPSTATTAPPTKAVAAVGAGAAAAAIAPNAAAQAATVGKNWLGLMAGTLTPFELHYVAKFSF